MLPEYALTGSLVLDQEADVHDWAFQCAQAKTHIQMQEGKHLLINALIEQSSKLYNCCELLPDGEHYCKLFPDETELKAGIQPGVEQKDFELFGKRFQVLIYYDLPHTDSIPTDHLGFLLFIYHFTQENLAHVMGAIQEVSKERSLIVLASSLVSDKNNGFSSYVNCDTVISLSSHEGVLEIDIE